MALTINHIAKAATALGATGQHDLASEFWAAALDVAPDDPALLTAAGVTFRARRMAADAEAVLRRAIAIEPTARRHVVLACSIHDQLRFDECEAAMRRARALDPNSADAAGLLGIWLLERWHWRDSSDDVLHEAIEHIERGIELAPDNYNFLSTRLAALIAADCLDDAIAEATRLIGRYPLIPELHVNRAAARMKLGMLTAGFIEFGEWTYKLPRLAGHPFHRYPQWDPYREAPNPKNQIPTEKIKSQEPNSGRDRCTSPFEISDLDLGSSSPGGEVYVWNLEGAGDHFQFIRFATDMARDGWRVHAICNRTMDRLIARVPGVASVVGEDEEIPDDATVATLPSLPAAYVGLVPLWSGPYLTPDPATVAKWRDRILGASDLGFGAYSLRVGVAWRGNPKQVNDERRSFDPARFAPLSEVPQIALISLQKGHPEQLASGNLRLATPIFDLGDEYQAGDWLDTAGVIANLDLVIAPCTAIAHLAGAMGKPVWLALSQPGCWRWGMKGRDEGRGMRDESENPGPVHPSSLIPHPSERSVWYPSMRIFRQRVRGSWDGVFEAMAAALAERVEAAA